ncbi:MAG: hypothetical protein IJU79_05485 [Desulfovibrionaceae bacterium]|nr:hypothetical protein [Desulfovibrionaceae bacterium]
MAKVMGSAVPYVPRDKCRIQKACNLLILLVRLARFELTAFGSGGQRYTH